MLANGKISTSLEKHRHLCGSRWKRKASCCSTRGRGKKKFLTPEVAKKDYSNRSKHFPHRALVNRTWLQRACADVSGSRLDQVPFPAGVDILSMPINLIFLSPAIWKVSKSGRFFFMLFMGPDHGDTGPAIKKIIIIKTITTPPVDRSTIHNESGFIPFTDCMQNIKVQVISSTIRSPKTD